MAVLKQSTAYTRTFLMVQSSDHITGITGATVTVKISKAGATGAAAAGAVSEVDAANNPGLYKVALTTADTGTLGDLSYHCTATSADPTDFIDQVAANILGDTLPANTTQLAGQTVTAAAGVTFPSSVASPTNITAGTIATVTNLTNAATAGDFTAAMKTSLNAATPASVVGAVGSVTGAVGSVTGAVGSVTGNVGGNVVGSVGSVTAGVNATAINGSTVAATQIGLSGQKIGNGTVGTGSTTTSIVASAVTPSNVAAGQFQGRIMIFDNATTTTSLRGQATVISTDNGSGTFTVAALTTAPVNGDTFTIT